ncbi:MAG: MBL fold metallo-hydrolase [Planctomycetia bacterium]|nr:MBL fold metallo-hydrolase [Planctomycetia bacterium]
MTDRNDALLFDAGDTSAHDGGTEFIQRQLWKMNLKRLRGLFISHPHLDHQSAVPGLIAANTLDCIFLADSYRSQPQGQSLIHLANKYSVPLKWITDGNRFRIGSFEVFVISAEQPPIAGIQINDMSPLILIRWKETYILTSGDAQSGVLSASLITGPIDHVLIPHHGSPAPNLKSWLSRLQARTFWVARKKPLPPETSLFLQPQDINHVKYHGDNINVLTIQQQFEDTQDPRRIPSQIPCQIPREKHELSLLLHRFQNFRFRLEQKIGESPK